MVIPLRINVMFDTDNPEAVRKLLELANELDAEDGGPAHITDTDEALSVVFSAPAYIPVLTARAGHSAFTGYTVETLQPHLV